MIYIVSRGRVDVLEKNIKRWLKYEVEQRFGLSVIVEANERQDYKDMLHRQSPDIEVIALKKGQTGVAASRNTAFRRSWRNGDRSFLVSDDDVAIRDDPELLLKAARTKKTLGVGAMFSMYPLMFGAKHNTGIYMIKSGGFGFCCYALNTQNMDAVGAWDRDWIGVGQMDHGLAIKGITQLGLLWRINTDFNADFSVRMAPQDVTGGIVTLLKKKKMSRQQAWHEWHKVARLRYPDYVNDPKKCSVSKHSNDRCGLRYNWKKMIEDNCPTKIAEYPGKAIPIGG